MSNYNITMTKQKVTIHCKDKTMQEDLVVNAPVSSVVQWDGTYEEISSVVEITFTIDGVSYTAVEGMTWETYKGSEYDVLGLYDYIGTVASSVLSNSLVYYISGVEWTDTIQNGGTYTTGYFAGGAN